MSSAGAPVGPWRLEPAVPRRVIVLGAGAGGLPAGNRLTRHAATGVALEVVPVDRSPSHAAHPGAWR